MSGLRSALRDLTNAKSRLNRKGYALGVLGIFMLIPVWLIGFALIRGHRLDLESPDLASVTMYLLAMGMIYYLTIKRLHDLDRSGLYSILLLIPVVGIAFWAYAFFWPGTKGPNRFDYQWQLKRLVDQRAKASLPDRIAELEKQLAELKAKEAPKAVGRD